MCAMALLHRAEALSKHKQSHRSISKLDQTSEQTSQLPADLRMPANFIGMPLASVCPTEQPARPVAAGDSAPSSCLP